MSIDQQSCVQLQLYETTSTIFWQGKASKWKFQARHILISGFILILHMLWWIGSDLIEHVSPDHTLMANLFHNILNKRILVVTKNMCFCFSSSVPIHLSDFSHSSISSSIHPAWPGNTDIPEVDLSLCKTVSATVAPSWLKSQQNPGALRAFIMLKTSQFHLLNSALTGTLPAVISHTTKNVNSLNVPRDTDELCTLISVFRLIETSWWSYMTWVSGKCNYCGDNLSAVV